MNWLWFVLIGITGGILSGLLGVGGGLVFIPLLVFLTRFDMHLAIGTSLAIIIPTAIAGLWRHAQAGQTDWRAAILIALFAILGAWIGAGLSLRMDTLLLRRLFAVLLVAMAVKMFFRN